MEEESEKKKIEEIKIQAMGEKREKEAETVDKIRREGVHKGDECRRIKEGDGDKTEYSEGKGQLRQRREVQAM